MGERILLLLLTTIACYYDLRYRQIPNWLLLFSLPAIVLKSDSGGLVGLLGSTMMAAAIHLPAYLRGWLGGGDVKLAFSLACYLGGQFFSAWIFAALYSGFWGGFILFRGRGLAGFYDLAAIFCNGRASSGKGFPYGVALALGTWTAIFWC